MKEFIKNKKVTYNLMSFTGFKALILFSNLVESPKSYKEICDIFYNHPYLREKISIDTMRVYINSLKLIGCNVKRVRGEDKVSRYTILSHPFELKLTDEQKQSVLKLFKSIVKNIEIEDLISLEEFFEKIGVYIKNEEFIDEVKNISLLKGIDKELLKDLLDCCNKKQQIVINYESPNSGTKDIELIADKVNITNGKIYLYGTGFEYMQYGSFLVSRINRINEIKLIRDNNIKLNDIKVKYEVFLPNVEIQEDERVVEQTDEKTVIEASTSNIFMLRQKLLEYGPLCRVLEPVEFKNEFVALLKDMKAGYYCE